MRDAVIIDAVRTPVGKFRGQLSGVHPVDLSGRVLEALAERNDVAPSLVEDVIWGCVSQVGEQASNVGRLAVLAAGWPEGIPGTTIDRACGSSQQAITFAAAALMSGQCDMVVAGGVESMSRVAIDAAVQGPGHPYGSAVRARYPEALGEDALFNQGLAAEMLAERWELSREQLDQYSLRSHQRAAYATDAGWFEAETVALSVRRDAAEEVVQTDEGIRRDTSLERLAGLRTVFKPDGVVTAGNSSQISDGAAALLLCTSERAAQLGLRPLARIHASATVGVDPILMLHGPISATERVLKRAALELTDVNHVEMNEAFASVVCAWAKETESDQSRLNPCGGAIALGHPLGSSGARLATTLVHRLTSSGGRYGLQVMCEGGGMANAMVYESLA